MRQMLVSIHFIDEETGIRKWAVACSCMAPWLLVVFESEFELRTLTSEHLLLTQTSDKPQLLTCLPSLFSRNATTSRLSVPSCHYWEWLDLSLSSLHFLPKFELTSTLICWWRACGRSYSMSTCDILIHFQGNYCNTLNGRFKGYLFPCNLWAVLWKSHNWNNWSVKKEKKDKSQSTILLSLTHHPDFMWYCGNSPTFEYCSGQQGRARGRGFRVTSDTARGWVTWAEPLTLFREWVPHPQRCASTPCVSSWIRCCCKIHVFYGWWPRCWLKKEPQPKSSALCFIRWEFLGLQARETASQVTLRESLWGGGGGGVSLHRRFQQRAGSVNINTCIPVADSFWCLAKLIQLCKV